jgi:CheY-like chemotaxis protein
MGKKILLADDSITIQKVIELTFSDEDFDVVTVGNGRLAVERVQEVRPDIVLCDIIMPEKDGYEVCDFIKRNPQLAHVPVLLLTGAFEPFDQERAARVGCDGFLAKPFEPETLIAKVKDLLQKAAARSSSTGSRPAVQVPPQAPAPAPAAPAVAAIPPAQNTVRMPTVAPPAVAAPMAVAAPAPPEPLPFVPRTPAPAEEVRFIPDEPFDDLDATDFGGGPAAVAAEPPMPSGPVAEPTLPPAPPEEPEVHQVPDELEAGPEELLQMTPEESQSLTPPPAADDSSSTVMFRPGVSWSQPTMEVPLETRAQASVEAAQASPPPPYEEPPVFEEVLEEEVESLVEAGPVPVDEPEVEVASPVAAAPPPPAPPAAPPAPVFEEPAVPEVRGAALEPEPLPEPEPAPAPAPLAAAPPAPEPEPLPPPAIPEPPPAIEEPPAPSAPSAIESFVDVAAPTPSAAPAEPAPRPAAAGMEVGVPDEVVAQIAQRVVAQISEQVVRQIAWEVIPDLAEGLIKKEIERLKAELQET